MLGNSVSGDKQGTRDIRGFAALILTVLLIIWLSERWMTAQQANSIFSQEKSPEEITNEIAKSLLKIVKQELNSTNKRTLSPAKNNFTTTSAGNQTHQTNVDGRKSNRQSKASASETITEGNSKNSSDRDIRPWPAYPEFGQHIASNWSENPSQYGVLFYSAYYDDRRIWEDSLVIVVLGIIHVVNMEKRINWFLTNVDPKTQIHKQISIDDAHCYQFQVYKSNVACVLPLKNPADFTNTTMVEVVRDNAQLLFTLPVSVPPKPGVKRKLNICMSAISTNRVTTPSRFHNEDYFVAWVEFQRLLGVEHITLSNISLSHQWDRAIAHYTLLGVINVRRNRRTQIFQESVDITDCLYRHMHSFQYTLVMDTDELLIPTRHDTIPQLIEDLLWSYNVDPITNNISDLVFPHALFCDDIPDVRKPNDNSPVFFHIRRHKNVNGSEFGSWGKSISNPQVCFAHHPHHCDRFEDNQLKPEKQKKVIVAERSDAMVYHYKACKSGVTWNVLTQRTMLGSDWKEYWNSDMVDDERIMYFKPKLEKNVAMVMQQLEQTTPTVNL